MFQIKERNQNAEIYTPYNGEFVKKVKMIGGARWNSDSRCWTVPVSAIDSVREIMRACYGRDDMVEGETVRVRLTFNSEMHEYCAPVTIYGHTIASARGRDSGARVGEGVSFIYGSCTSGGSAKNWTTVIEAGSVVEIAKVSKSLYESEELPEHITAEIVEAGHTTSREALMAERERLKARLAEIEKQLAEMD